MLYQADDGYYLFLYHSHDDGPCAEDEWYLHLEELYAKAANEYAVTEHDWVEIPDPVPGAQTDWIAPTCVVVGKDGSRRFVPA
jgi:hypothetical protein